MLYLFVSMTLIILAVILALLGIRKKFVNFSTSSVNLLLSEILEIGFRNNSLSGASESISAILRRFYAIDYVTILLFHERSRKLSVIASNVEQQHVASIESYCNTFIDSTSINLSAKSSILSKDIKAYDSTNERGVHFSGFTPLMWNDRILGGVLLEGKHGSSSVLRKKDFLYDRVFKAISLVIRNIIYTENLISLASTDQLTKVHNRRFIDTTLEEQLHTHSIVGTPFTVVLMDIDHFKRFNDTYGHQFGDYVLQEVANFLQSRMTEEDEWVARYGGEEFLLFFGRSADKNVSKRIEDMRRDLSRLRLCEGGVITNVTASFGLVTYPNAGECVQELLEKVDLALYKSKENGRNLVTVYDKSS